MRKDVARNRDHLLATARTLLEQRGVAFTFNELAKAAQVGVGTVYRHFSNKNELFDLLLVEPLEEVVAIARQGAAKPISIENFRQTLMEICEFLVEHKAIAQVLFAGDAQRVETIQTQMLEELNSLVCAVARLPQVRSDLSVTDLPLIFSYSGYVGTLTEYEESGVWRRYIDAMITGLVMESQQEVPPALSTEKLDHAMRRNQQKLVKFLQEN